MKEIEYFFTCPYCHEEISMLLDCSQGGQSYIEDCEVCCNPIEVIFLVAAGEIENFSANRVQ
jgi:hypothetical protein